MDHLRQGFPVAIAAFMRAQGPFRQGRLLLRAASPDPIIWEQYRFLLGYKPVKSLPPPYEIRRVGRVSGRGAWNVDEYLFKAVHLVAGTEDIEIAIPDADLSFLGEALAWLNQERPLLARVNYALFCASGANRGFRTTPRIRTAWENTAYYGSRTLLAGQGLGVNIRVCLPGFESTVESGRAGLLRSNCQGPALDGFGSTTTSSRDAPCAA
jgi:hypothetical protein